MKRVARRLLATLGLAAAVGMTTASCGKPEDTAVKDLRAAIAKTSKLPTQFSYDEVTNDGVSTEVQGVIEDDFRYKSRLYVDKAKVLDEVVFDDAIADHFYDPTAVGQFIRKTAVPTAPVAGLPTKSETVSQLQAGQWVLDPSGAPSVLGTTDRRVRGEDPIVDARNFFGYVEAVARTMIVRKFNPDALDYKPKEDPFPKPQKGSGVTRYDFVRVPVPRPSQAGGGNQAVPSEVCFRKMGVYVKNGIIIRVLEDIDVASRLRDIQRNYGVKLTGTVPEQIDQAIAAINVVRKGQGTLDPIRVRKLEFSMTKTGSKQRVTIPDSTVPGDLSVLSGRGRTKTGAALNPANNGAAAGATEDTTTTSLPTTSAP